MQLLNAETAVLDGEVVVLDEHGVSSFAALQAAFDEKKPDALTYFCFDLLHMNRHTLRGAPLHERKALLHSVIEQADQETMRFSEHLDADGAQMFREACRLGAEGIVSKRGRCEICLRSQRKLEQNQVHSPAGVCGWRIHASPQKAAME